MDKHEKKIVVRDEARRQLREVFALAFSPYGKIGYWKFFQVFGVLTFAAFLPAMYAFGTLITEMPSDAQVRGEEYTISLSVVISFFALIAIIVGYLYCVSALLIKKIRTIGLRGSNFLWLALTGILAMILRSNNVAVIEIVGALFLVGFWIMLLLVVFLPAHTRNSDR